MKCPKCSYVSFDYLNECRKCGRDLGLFKAEIGIDFAQPVSLGIINFLETGSSASGAEVETEFAGADVTAGQVSEPAEVDSSLSADDLLAEIKGGGEAPAAVSEAEGESGISLDMDEETGMTGGPSAEEGGGISMDIGGEEIGMDLNLDTDLESDGETQVADLGASAETAEEDEDGISLDLDLGDNIGAPEAETEEPAVAPADTGRDDEGITPDVGDAPDTADKAEIGIELSADEEEPILELGSDVADAADDEISLDTSSGDDLEAGLDLDDSVDLGTASEGGLSLDEDLPLDLSDASEDSGLILSMDDDLGGLDINLDDEPIDIGSSATDEKDESPTDDDLGGLDLSFDDDDDEVK